MGKVIKINIKIILNKRNLDEAPTSYLSQKEEPTILKDSEAICFFKIRVYVLLAILLYKTDLILDTKTH